MNRCPNREKVLLNLKWFVNRFIKSFESKLIQAISYASNSCVQSPSGSSNVSSPTLSASKVSIKNENVSSDLPFIRRLLDQQIKCGNKRLKNESSYSSRDISVQNTDQKQTYHSPLMKIRSLTNSPLFRRLSFTLNNNKRQSLLSQDEKNDWIKNHSDFDEPCEFVRRKPKVPDVTITRKCYSNAQSPSCTPFEQNVSNTYRGPLFRLAELTTESQRFSILSGFAQQLCIIYEYQLGMLRNLPSIHAAADYVADVVIRAIKLKKISGINSRTLTPLILFDGECRPNTYNKTVKTLPLTVTGEQMSWKLGEIWTLPGLRHNEVGGENCHNLSIVTHFLSTVTPSGDYSRSDIYGYRNLILLTNEKNTETINNSNCYIYDTNFPSVAESFSLKSDVYHSDKMNSYFTISSFDYATISSSRIKPGNIPDPPSSDDSLTEENPQSTKRNDDTKSSSQSSPENKIKESSRRNHSSSSVVMLRQHLHRAYRPVFFLIYNRPSVIEHLTECDSFASFCKRQALSPRQSSHFPTTLTK
ncbi:hypothetical protein Smp_133580 [Schistosoma mansoni]|uniref:hypothetical protein n=1 Tax=Schistosoma mansoni TaxID=6183 RepID=UPI00022DC347|nr:hypothetical protein Smp_133580 [Schistosoma mansoni]|eukprot:XP_018650566.1 hypothetical protein Smp_133580 [Schistosoma mansoni]